ncbi:MAG: hypothetical protein KIT45_11015, partial [Fimbriimonadia bacterium]|nr:hypothetical protein [Fimbriimonadia bacterium]
KRKDGILRSLVSYAFYYSPRALKLLPALLTGSEEGVISVVEKSLWYNTLVSLFRKINLNESWASCTLGVPYQAKLLN